MGKFDGRVALVSGAARGQGRMHALALAREGAAVALLDICADNDNLYYPLATKDQLQRTADEVRSLGVDALSIVADVRSSTDVDEAVNQVFTELGAVDTLVANAGIFRCGPTVAELTDDQWTDMLDTNLTGVFRLCRAVVPHMSANRFGRIIITSSMAGRVGYANMSHYVASKWGLIGFAKSLALEVAADGVTVNVICPANVLTDMIMNEPTFQQFVPDKEHPTWEDVRPVFAALSPIPQPGLQPEEVSHTLMFLAARESGHLTGTVLDVSLGMSANNTA